MCVCVCVCVCGWWVSGDICIIIIKIIANESILQLLCLATMDNHTNHKN